MICLVGIIDLLHDVLHLGLVRKNGNKGYGELWEEAPHIPNMIPIEPCNFYPIPGVYLIHSPISPSKTKVRISQELCAPNYDRIQHHPVLFYKSSLSLV